MKANNLIGNFRNLKKFEKKANVLSEPAHEKLEHVQFIYIVHLYVDPSLLIIIQPVLIAYASSEGFGEPAQFSCLRFRLLAFPKKKIYSYRNTFRVSNVMAPDILL